MIHKIRVESSTIFSEFSEDDKKNWFDMRINKFLHTVDTFYYSVKLVEDFTSNTSDKDVLNFRKYVDNILIKCSNFDDVVQVYFESMGEYLNVARGVFSMFYSFHLICPDEFDIFFAPVVPGSDGGSVTSEIIVQIRSAALWKFGFIKAYERSVSFVKELVFQHGFHIVEIKENRTDYCFHSNYLVSPYKYFRIDNFDAMRVTRLGPLTNQIYKDKDSSSSELSYLCRGSRGSKVFLRIYNKTQEVCEEAYKEFFLKTWLFHGLINRYDFYIYEKCFKQKKYLPYITIPRLMFYSEYGSSEHYINECKRYIAMYDMGEKVTDNMIKLANLLTPEPTIIMNVEFQLMRKCSKSYNLVQFKDNSSKGVEQRIYDFHDNHRLIVDYLTSNTFRLVDPTGDNNKSRRSDCPFWQALRNSKYVDAPAIPAGIKMTRIYHRELRSDIIKRDFINKAVMYGTYIKGKNQDNPVSDIMLALLTLNDNDFANAKRYKVKKNKQLSNNLLSFSMLSNIQTDGRYKVIDSYTGEFVDLLTDFNNEDI